MSKGAYYAGMATAPQVKPADFLSPVQGMLNALDERLLREKKEALAQEKARKKFALSERDEFDKTLNASSFKGFGLNSLDQASAEFTKFLKQNFEGAEEAFSNKQIDEEGLASFNTGLQSSAKRVQNIAADVQNFMAIDDRLAAQGNDSHWNDLVASWIGDAERNLRFDVDDKGVVGLVTIGEDDVQRKLPASQVLDFMQAREATNIPKLVQDLANSTEGFTFETEKSSVTRYLDYSNDPNGELTASQAGILTKQLMALDPRDVYDAAVRYGVVGDEEGQVQIVTDFNNENLITKENLSQMRKLVGLAAAEQFKDSLRNKNTSKPRTPRGGNGTNKTYAIYDDESQKYSYRRNSQTAFSMKSGFSGKDMINGNPTGENKDVPPGSNITDIRLTPFGLEIWGTQIKDEEGRVLFTREAASLSSEEVSAMGGNRVNFHKVVDPMSNESAIGELQRTFGFPVEEYQEMLKLNTVVDEETGIEVSQDDLSAENSDY